jgi:hypothetical protein
MKTLMLLLISMAVGAGASAQPAPASVIVWARHYGGQVLYAYEVQNLSAKPMGRFWIGRDIAADGMNGAAELTIAPLSANSTFWLSSDVGRAPAGWGVAINYAEESSIFSLECIEAGYFTRLWPSAPTQDAPRAVVGGNAIQPGATLGGFVVALPQDDLRYVRGHATFSTDSGFFSVPMTPGDKTPPSIAMNVIRLNQNGTNGQWAIFNVSYEVSDNYDPSPTTAFQLLSSPSADLGEVVMEKDNANAWSVKVRNIPGRLYTFRVQSSDASGNAATKTYAYAVAPATR